MNIEKLYETYLNHPEVTTDSRHCPVGSMFFALRGESFDGNLFAASALAAGSAVAVVDDETVIPEGDTRYILVPDVLEALQALAAYHRQQFRKPVIQITGTNGKTTTKELIAAVLGQRYRVLYTQGNLNNHIGVPLTLLRLRTEEHDLAVIETGANHPGEIAFLTGFVQPDYGLITNVGRAHIEGFGSFEGVKRTKGELYDYLRGQSAARIFVSVSNPDLCGMLRERGISLDAGKCVTYARHQTHSPSARCVGDVEACDPLLRLWWRELPEGREMHVIQTRLIGAYNIDNVLSAVAVGLHFGVTADDICAALAGYQPSLGRSEFRATEHNQLIVDAYNANLTSMDAALDNFCHISHPGKMLILGDMKELGDVSADAHRQVAAQAFRSGAKTVWLVGDAFRDAVGQLPAPAGVVVETFHDVEAVKSRIRLQMPVGKLILIKGSNSTRLHQLPPLL